MEKIFKCIYCGTPFTVELDEDANYGSEPDTCDECLDSSHIPEDYFIPSDADPGL